MKKSNKVTLEWIDVNDRLPETELIDTFLVVLQEGDKRMVVTTEWCPAGKFGNESSEGVFIWDGEPDSIGNLVTHWMPLPPLPGEKKEFRQ